MWVCRDINSFESDESKSFQEAHLGVPSKQSKAISVPALSSESLFPSTRQLHPFFGV
jgi:hypothetical protein